MDFIRVVSLFVLITLLVDGATRPQKVLKRSKRNHVNCRPNSLVRYRLTVETLWSKQTFPKMFPTYRPHAQWSVLVGRTHGPDYKMWEEGVNATVGVKLFAEQADASQLDAESVQGYDDILDSFVAPPINMGVGQTSTIVILDGHSSRLSFMMRIIPSPDWFIGVNSLDLCAHGRWKNKVHIDLSPFDAGSDQGLTFTAPNWPNTPQMPITAITSSFPDHPASSFFYPEFKNLPRLAFLELDIVSEYRHRETFLKVTHHYNATAKHESNNERKAKDDEKSTTTKLDSKLSPFSAIFNKVAEKSSKHHSDNHPVTKDISAIFDAPRHSNSSWNKKKEDNLITINGSRLTTNRDNDEEMNEDTNKKETHKTTTRNVDTENDPTRNTELKSALDSRFVSSQNQGYFTARTSEADSGDSLHGSYRNNAVDSSKDASKLGHIFKLDDLLRRPGKSHWKHDSTESTPEAQSILPAVPDDHRFVGTTTPRPLEFYGASYVDCEVSEWSEWSECSQSCGFGQLERTRSVSTYPQNGGANCPRLTETNLCGSMRNCQWTPFTFLSPNATKRQMREGRNRRPRVLAPKVQEKPH